MHNPTRRVRRPSSSAGRPLNTPTGQDSSALSSLNHVRHRQASRPDVLRGAMLVALVVVTTVLYTVLWELERSSFASVPKLNPMVDSSTSDDSTPRRYPPAITLLSGDEPNLSNAPLSSEPGPMTRNAWPPAITRIPEEHDIEDITDEHTHMDQTMKLSTFDSAYRDGTRRFLLPVRIGEQESKARGHFSQLLVLAKRLNRTIVLPNVGKSRMSACSKWPFGAYYDTSMFAQRGSSPGSWPAIDLGRFADWVDERPVPPNSLVVSMRQGTQPEWEDAPFVVEKTEIDPKILTCLEHKPARLRSSLPEMALSISIDSGSLKADLGLSNRLVKFLSNSDTSMDSDFDLITGLAYDYVPQHVNTSVSLADADVLVLDYDLRYPLFDTSAHANVHLHYAPALYDLSDRLSDNLGPFLGVHWRMEGVPMQNLAWCAASLVSVLRTRLQDHDDDASTSMRHVWLATDHPRPLSSFMDGVRFPIPIDDRRSELDGVGSDKDGDGSPLRTGGLRKSSTFKAIEREHDDAIGILTEAFQPGGDLEAWKLTDLAEQLRRYPYVEGRFDVDEALLGDSGVSGILDKLVIVQARVFVSGSADCGKASSFSKQIIEARQEAFETERGKGAIRNVVEYFGKW